MIDLVCPQCNRSFSRFAGHVNRSRARGDNLYCGRVCSGLGRRQNKTREQKKLEKRAYDMDYRTKNLAMLKQKKAKHYKESMTPEKRAKEKAYRVKRMPAHVAYCQRPEYRVKKKDYDQRYRARRIFGDFGESFLLLQQIEGELDSRMSWHDRAVAKGNLNKKQHRRREYEKTFSQ